MPKAWNDYRIILFVQLKCRRHDMIISPLRGLGMSLYTNFYNHFNPLGLQLILAIIKHELQNKKIKLRFCFLG